MGRSKDSLFVFVHVLLWRPTTARPNYPPQTAELNNWVAWYFYIVPISVATGIVAMLLIRALEKSGLQRVPGSVLDTATD